MPPSRGYNGITMSHSSSFRLPHKLRTSARAADVSLPNTGATCRGAAPPIPYHILVSEMMLQQTQVERVTPKFAEWLQNYPTLTALADAELNDVKAPGRG